MAPEQTETLDEVCEQAYKEKNAEPYTWTQILEKMNWIRLVYTVFFHAAFIAAVYSYVFGLHSVPIKSLTIAWGILIGWISSVSITAGAHRLWTHRTYKTNLPLKIWLMMTYNIVGIYSLWKWIRDHRVHHKYTETNADPHNAKRGFFFSHVGWILVQPHPEFDRRRREINMKDILADPVVMFQKEYALSLTGMFCFVIPTAIPVIFWEETLLHAVLTQCVIRYVIVSNVMFAVNSVTHLWGSRPYNKLINPVENLAISLVTQGEGSHNYHHTFPWDYKASELPYMNFNTTTLFIDAMAKLGWAYDLRIASPALIEKVVRRIGYKSEVKECN